MFCLKYTLAIDNILIFKIYFIYILGDADKNKSVYIIFVRDWGCGDLMDWS